MPSIACEKLRENGSWEYHFILINRNKIFIENNQAEDTAEKDIAKAFEVKNINGSDSDFAMELKRKGYTKVGDFSIVD